MEPLVLTPTDFIAITNQVLETSFGYINIVGEVSSFRISKQKWVYFDLKDDYSKVHCFASIYAMPGPIEDGMVVRVSGNPRMHPQFGFSFTAQSLQPVGEGSLHQAFALLKAKLQEEGLFAPERKRYMPEIPTKVALVASLESAAYADFIKVTNARWPFVDIEVYDTLVQGENAPTSLVAAIDKANGNPNLADVLVITRGGGSGDDLAAFNDERVVRAIAASRMPTMVAIGHEVDESLSELTADKRASTPSNAAELLVPDKTAEIANLKAYKKHLAQSALSVAAVELQSVKLLKQRLSSGLKAMYSDEHARIDNIKHLLGSYNPHNVLARGYAIVKNGKTVIKTAEQAEDYKDYEISFKDGQISARKV